MDTASMEEFRFEPPERPPSLEHLHQMTAHRFSRRWLKYMYNRFKNECPSGRMNFAEFKRLFGVFIPDRLNDGYLLRVFRAFCQQSSTHHDQLTFRDLMIGLSRLCDEKPAASADWLMRLIGRERDGQVSYQELVEFVKSVFTLRGKAELNEQKKRDGSLLLGGGRAASGDSPTSTIRTPNASLNGSRKMTGRSKMGQHQHQQVHWHHSQWFPRHHPLLHQPQHDQQQQQHHTRPTAVRSAALLASAITAPTAAPAIASFMPFVSGHGGSKRDSGNSPDQQTIRAIGQRAMLMFKELDMDNKGYLTGSDFEKFFRDSETQQKSLLIYAS